MRIFVKIRRCICEQIDLCSHEEVYVQMHVIRFGKLSLASLVESHQCVDLVAMRVELAPLALECREVRFGASFADQLRR